MPYAVYGYGAQIVELAVDRALGTVRLLRITAAHDVGRAINPTLAEGQIEGGIAQGIGMALMEEYLPGRTENLHDYLIPTIGDVPEIVPILIEKPDPEGPFGAKGLGEHVLIPTAPGDPERHPPRHRRRDHPAAGPAPPRPRGHPPRRGPPVTPPAAIAATRCMRCACVVHAVHPRRSRRPIRARPGRTPPRVPPGISYWHETLSGSPGALQGGRKAAANRPLNILPGQAPARLPSAGRAAASRGASPGPSPAMHRTLAR